jgi:lysophospholipase L1-like esterase
MKTILLILFLTSNNFCSKISNDRMPEVKDTTRRKIYYLALGDSYTIGQNVSPAENFPNQAVALLQNDRFDFESGIIAKTGWTTDELEKGIAEANSIAPLQSSYDFVSLLIGVNNQYRGRTVENYKSEFEALLKKAIQFSGNHTDHVIVISIPDWSVTPFAAGRDRIQIAKEIDEYNAANKKIALQYNVEYLDITQWTREAGTDFSLIANDGLHPSGKEYKRWADKIVAFFKTKI